jgi:hypothetical protein
MKLRTKRYIRRQKALRNMFQFNDLRTFLMTSFQASRSLVVKKDIVTMMAKLNTSPARDYAMAS